MEKLDKSNIPKVILYKAYHEAGHAVMCWKEGVVPKEITMSPENKHWGSIRMVSGFKMPTEQGLGFSQFKDPLNEFGFEDLDIEFEEKAKKLALVYLAGEIAVKLVHPKKDPPWNWGFANDKKQAYRCIQRITKSGKEEDELIERLQQDIESIFSKNNIWHGLEIIATVLKKEKTIDWKKAQKIIQCAVDQVEYIPYEIEKAIEVLDKEGILSKEEALERMRSRKQ